MELSKKLKEDHEFLKSKCDTFEIKDITGTDLYYSDGLVQGADFKIEFILKDTNYLRYIYIWPSGKWYSASNDEKIKQLINEWIQQVKLKLKLIMQENTSVDK
jgi:hypothetical protein